ncbi:hypothetical protein BKI52_41250 [marine bacterium AO1-C]|nr:hypothetical protein BKI52_41250 [marine bacterium AO1-C]
MIKTYLWVLYTSIITTCLLSSCNQQKSTSTGIASPEDTLVQIPNEWIEKLKNPQSPAHELINEFEALLYPEQKDNLVKKRSTDDLLLKPTFINVDESPEKELLLWIGHAQISEFAIIKKIKDKWRLLYSKEHHTLWVAPTLRIGDSLSTSTPKVFYVAHLYGRGSGFGWGKWHFYRVENNQVINGLKAISGAVDAFGHYVSTDVHTKVQIKDANHLNILYDYKFTFRAHNDLEEDYLCKNDSTLMWVPFIQGTINLHYVWNSSTKKYQVADKALQTKEKFMNESGSLSEFYEAFRPEIKQSTHPNRNKIIEVFEKVIAAEQKDTTPHKKVVSVFFGYNGPSYYETRAKK